MRQLFILLLTAIPLAAKPAWKPLFNGVSFKQDWHSVGDSSFWTVDAADSAVVGYSPTTKTPHSLLFTNKADYDQFTVKYAYRLKAGCSGFWFRTKGLVPGEIEGPQVEVKRENEELHEVGSIYVHPQPGWTVQHSNAWSVKTAPKKDEYQHVVLTVKKPFVYVNVNGVQAVGETDAAAITAGAKPAWDYTATTYAKNPGAFALQVHKDYAIDVRFKDIAILTGCGDKASAAYGGDFVAGMPKQPAVYQDDGSCQGTGTVTPGSGARAGRAGKLSGYLAGPRPGAMGWVIEASCPGANTLELIAPDGRVAFSGSAPGPMAYSPRVKPGVYLAVLKAEGATASRRVWMP